MSTRAAVALLMPTGKAACLPGASRVFRALHRAGSSSSQPKQGSASELRLHLTLLQSGKSDSAMRVRCSAPEWGGQTRRQFSKLTSGGSSCPALLLSDTCAALSSERPRTQTRALKVHAHVLSPYHGDARATGSGLSYHAAQIEAFMHCSAEAGWCLDPSPLALQLSYKYRYLQIKSKWMAI